MERALAIAAVLVAGLALWGLARRFVRHRFDVMFLALALLAYWFVFRPAQLALGLDGATPDYLFPADFLPLVVVAELAALLWLAAFAVGALAADVAGAPAMALFPRLEGEPRPILALAALLAVTALGGLVTLWLLAASGGDLADSIRYVKSEKAATGLYFLRQFAVVGALLAAFVLAYMTYLAGARGARTPAWQTLLALVCFGLNAFGVYAWGQRYAIAMATVAVVAGYHYFVRRLSWLKLALLAAAFVAVFLGLRLLRDALLFPGDLETPLEAGNIWRKIAISMHGAQYDALLLALRDFDLEAGLRWGEDFAAGLAALVPRQLWPDRPAFNPGAWFRQIYEPEKLNGWPLTPVGEWLVNFGWLGVAAGGALSGYLIRAAQRVYDDLWRNPWSTTMAATAALFVLPGGVTTATPQSLLSTIFPLFLVALLLRQLAPLGRRWG